MSQSKQLIADFAPPDSTKKNAIPQKPKPTDTPTIIKIKVMEILSTSD